MSRRGYQQQGYNGQGGHQLHYPSQQQQHGHHPQQQHSFQSPPGPHGSGPRDNRPPNPDFTPPAPPPPPKPAFPSRPPFDDVTSYNLAVNHSINHVSFSPPAFKGGDVLIAGDTGGSIRVYDVNRMDSNNNKDNFRELKGHSGTVECVTIETKHHRLISTGKDKTVKFWDLRSSRATHTVNLPYHNLHISLHPSNSKMVVCDLENNISEFDLDKMELTPNKMVQKTSRDLLNLVKYSPDGNHLFGTITRREVERNWGVIRVWDATSMDEKATIPVSERSVFGMEFSKNGKYLATGAADGLVGIWDLREMICLRTLPSLSCVVRSVAFSSDSKYIASGGSGSNIFVTDVETGENVHAIMADKVGSDMQCDSMAWHPSQPLLAYATKTSSGGGGGGRGQQNPARLRVLKVNA